MEMSEGSENFALRQKKVLRGPGPPLSVRATRTGWSGSSVG